MKNGLAKILLGTGSAGAGAMLIYVLGQMVQARPDLAWQYIEKSSMFLLTAGVLAMLWTGGTKAVAAMQNNAIAQQRSADAMEGLSTSLNVLAQAQGSELEAIKASLGSLHGKVDDLRSAQS